MTKLRLRDVWIQLPEVIKLMTESESGPKCLDPKASLFSINPLSTPILAQGRPVHWLIEKCPGACPQPWQCQELLDKWMHWHKFSSPQQTFTEHQPFARNCEWSWIWIWKPPSLYSLSSHPSKEGRRLWLCCQEGFMVSSNRQERMAVHSGFSPARFPPSNLF